jgi:TolB-like protein/DNA-binding winged helix-turn-helix (wHTH) protein/Tfp pilus assembly protein PilF
MDAIAARQFQFEGFTLDPMRRSLRTGGREVELRPKSFDVLLHLVELAGRLAAKDEIIAAVWPNVVATDESLARCVSDVRHALGDSGQAIIKTVPGRGYLFAAPVTVVAADAPATTRGDPAEPVAGSRPAGRLRRLVPAALSLAAAVLLAAAAGWWLWQQEMAAPPERASIAVLPFANLSGDAGQDYVGDGIADELTTSLGKFRTLFVVSGNSAAKFKGREADSAQIGRELGVRYLLSGSVRPDAERLRITAALVDVASGEQLWAERYDRGTGDIFAVQDNVTRQIVVRLAAHIDRSELERTMRKAPESWAAHDHYLRGNALMRGMQRNLRSATIVAARVAYEQALARDPRYAPAIQGLAFTYLTGWAQPVPDEPIRGEFAQQPVLDRAQQLAEQAVDLDPTLAEAHATLGWILYWQHGPEVGLKAFERAFEFNPNFVDGRFAILLSHGGRATEAVAYVRRIMRLDPLYPPLYTYFLGKGYFFLGQQEEAIELVRSAAARLPGFRPPAVMLAALAATTGRDEEASAAAAEVRRIQPDFSIAAYVRFMRLAREEDRQRLATGLRKAGLPE